MKQGCKVLYVINYRCEGLAADFGKTHKIVLTNKEKFRFRSKKDFGWGWVEKMQ
jgi:hypothetical protein